jgi:uncharacterized protein
LRAKVGAFTVQLAFHGGLRFFLRANAAARIERQLCEKTSVKDVIESCGVPHREVDLILVDASPVDFSFAVSSAKAVDLYPVDWKRCTFFPENRLQTIYMDRFVADGHLGKLVRDLRLLGLDVAYDRAAEDRQLVELASRDKRALLTRDRRLLMHSAVRDGYYLRSQKALAQNRRSLAALPAFLCPRPVYPLSLLQCVASAGGKSGGVRSTRTVDANLLRTFPTL